jgi:hypothetical protein
MNGKADEPRWFVVNANGTVALHYGIPALDEMQQVVGGDVEALPSPEPDMGVFVCMDGKRLSLPMNPKASGWMRPKLWPGDRIVGPMIVTGTVTADEVMGLTDEQVSRLQEVFG